MFGYVLADKSSLRIREYEYYRATYCGLCHAMGKCTGCLSRLTLSYDMTFFALVRESVTGTGVEFEKKRCVRHPIAPIKTVRPNAQLEYSALAGGILTSQKLLDDVNDERGVKRALACMLRALFSGMEKKSSAALPVMTGYVSERLEALSKLEHDRVASIDEPADVFGDIMAKFLSYELEGEERLVASNIGKRIGRWVYIADALDDYEKDLKSGSYNPFVLLYGEDGFTEENVKSISDMLEAELSMALDALDLLDEDGDRDRGEIIKNILCLGMPASVSRICDRYSKKKGDDK